jgi:hypothetical protein
MDIAPRGMEMGQMGKMGWKEKWMNSRSLATSYNSLNPAIYL